jgi:glycosyltransferase involved in cell wall biosynthesis
MKVSICCITYNQEKYIGQALDSMLMQQTNFDFEIVIGEDCSTDSTKSILISFQQKHPGKIILLPRPLNMGVRKNFLDVLQHCTGEYIAICEGDDYWTDPLKLQKQVDFMDASPGYNLCFHNNQIYFEDTGKSILSNDVNQPITTDIYDLIDHWYIMTCSMLFRNNIKEYPSWFTSVFNTDYALQMILMAHGGKVGYLPDVMGVYRKHTAGESGRTWGHDPYFWLIYLFNKLDKETNYMYSAAIKKRKEEVNKILIDYYGGVLKEGGRSIASRFKFWTRLNAIKINGGNYYYKKFLKQKNLQ